MLQLGRVAGKGEAVTVAVVSLAWAGLEGESPVCTRHTLSQQSPDIQQMEAGAGDALRRKQ